MMILGDWCLFQRLRKVAWLELEREELANGKRGLELTSMALTNLRYPHHLTDFSASASYFISATLRL